MSENKRGGTRRKIRDERGKKYRGFQKGPQNQPDYRSKNRKDKMKDIMDPKQILFLPKNLKDLNLGRAFLTGGQAKIAAKAPPPNKIDEKDFKVLRAEKAKGRGMGLQDEKVQPGKVMKARVGKSIKKDPTKTVNPFEKKSSKFMERRKKLAGAKSLIGKGGRLGAAAALLGLTGAGAAKLGQTIGKKMSEKKDKNQKTLRDFREQKKPGMPSEKTKTINSALNKLNKKMGGGMMQKPMGYRSGTMVKARGCKLGRTKPTKIT